MPFLDKVFGNRKSDSTDARYLLISCMVDVMLAVSAVTPVGWRNRRGGQPREAGTGGGEGNQ
jgi:hypothetical protein